MEVRELDIKNFVYDTFRECQQANCLTDISYEIDQHKKLAFGEDWAVVDQKSLNFWMLNACLDTYIPELTNAIERTHLFRMQEGQKVTESEKVQSYIVKIQAIVKQHFNVAIAEQTASVLAEGAQSTIQKGDRFFYTPLRSEWYQVMYWFTHPEESIREYLANEKTQSLKAILDNLATEDKEKWIRFYIQEMVKQHRFFPKPDCIQIIRKSMFKDLGVQITLDSLSRLVNKEFSQLQ